MHTCRAAVVFATSRPKRGVAPTASGVLRKPGWDPSESSTPASVCSVRVRGEGEG